MKKYVLTTKSESGDNYMYLIETDKQLNTKTLQKFLMEYGNDKDDEENYSYENVEILKEIDEFIKF